jgi:hypothetical protein
MNVMWAQFITVDVKAGQEGDLGTLSDLLEASEQANSGLLRLTIMQAERAEPGLLPRRLRERGEGPCPRK